MPVFVNKARSISPFDLTERERERGEEREREREREGEREREARSCWINSGCTKYIINLTLDLVGERSTS
jgi:hypothetical protein